MQTPAELKIDDLRIQVSHLPCWNVSITHGNDYANDKTFWFGTEKEAMKFARILQEKLHKIEIKVGYE